MVLAEANEFLNSAGGAPAARFEAVGDSITGEILDAEVRDQTNFTTGEVETWPDGRVKKQVVITLQTDLRSADIDDDDGVRRIFARGQMLTEIRKAVGRDGLAIGGKLWVKYDADGTPKQRGWNAPKLYKAKYQAPARSVDLSAADGDDDGDDGDAPF